jgi:ribosomal 50S subunit-recycling heat shock protein
MEPMSDLGNNLFDQVAIINEGQRIAIKLGRQQFALEVARVLGNRNKDAAAKLAALAELCKREEGE